MHFIIIKKINKYSREGFWVAFDQIGTSIGSIITIKIMSNVLDPQEFGYLILANTIVFLISSSLFGSIGQSFMRFWSIANETKQTNNFYIIVNQSLKFSILIAFIWTILIGIFTLRTSEFMWSILIMLSVLIATCSGWTAVRTSILTAARQRKPVALIHVGSIFLKTLIGWILVIRIGRRATVAMLGSLFATILLLVLAERYFKNYLYKNNPFGLRTEKNKNFIGSISKNIFLMAAFFLIWSIFSWIKSSTDRWALQSFYGPEIVASFSVVLQLANFPIVLMSNFLTSLFNPVAFQLAGNFNKSCRSSKANTLMIQMLLLYALGVIIMITVFSFYHQPLIIIISNKRYANFSSFLPIITFAVAFYQFGDILASFGVLFNRLQIFLAPKITSSLITALFMFLFSKLFGPKGPVWALNLAAALYTPWCIILTLKLLGKRDNPIFVLNIYNKNV